MAQSRLEKVGTIYTRVSSLIKAGAMNEENKPFWLNLYKAFPPKHEPRYDRPGLTTPIRQIFYKEDKIRARFHNEFKYYSKVNLLDTGHLSKTEQFLLIYKQLEREGIPEVELYEKAIQEFLSKIKSDKVEKETMDAERSSKPVLRRKVSVNISNIFDEKKVNAEAKVASEQSKEDLKEYKPITLSMEKWKLLEEEKDDEKKKSE